MHIFTIHPQMAGVAKKKELILDPDVNAADLSKSRNPNMQDPFDFCHYQLL